MKSLTRWVDADDGHLYDTGDEYPFDGRDIPDDRIKELSTAMNKAGFPLIEADKAEPRKKK